MNAFVSKWTEKPQFVLPVGQACIFSPLVFSGYISSGVYFAVIMVAFVSGSLININKQ